MTIQDSRFKDLSFDETADGLEQGKRLWASAMVGPEGGRLKISNLKSPLHGTVLKIPAGALETTTKIQIREGKHSGTFGIGPSVQLLPDGLKFKHPVELKIYHKHTNKVMNRFKEESELALYTYDNDNRQWVNGCLAGSNMQESSMVCHLRQF